MNPVESGVGAGAIDTRHTRVKEILYAASLEPAAERAAFLERACGDDQELRRELESLLAFGEEASPIDVVARAPSGQGRSSRFRAGRVLAGRYRVERLLGAGGMGEVYAVYDALLSQRVALKVLRNADTAQRRRLVEEVRLARLVTHPGVCRVYDIGEDAGIAFLTMQLIDGEDLATYLAHSGRLPSDEVRTIAVRLGAALAAAHEVGVLHRDLKPSNILVARDGALYITDFGIATSRALTRDAKPREGVLLGTPMYMAPEETEPQGIATQRSDLYSLGLVLYELLTGAPPFDAFDIETVLALHRSAAPDPPSRLVPDVDAALERLVMLLLAKDPAARPESARAVIESLSDGPPSALLATLPPSTSERRQLIAMVCLLQAPEDVRTDARWPGLVRIFQARSTSSCRLQGGRVVRHLARGLLVHFGLPYRTEQDAERAVEAGREIAADLGERPLLGPERGRLGATIVVDAVMAQVGAGRAIVVERRLDQITDSGPDALPAGVLVTAAVLPLVRGAFATAPFDGAGGDALQRVMGTRQRLGLDGGAARLSPFAGRLLELDRLEQWWRDAADGKGQVVLVSGEAGLGKSRIVHELWQRVRQEGIGLEARCSSVHLHTPLFPFVGMVALAAGLEAGDPAEVRTAKLRRGLQALGGRLETLLPVFSDWLSSSRSTGPVSGGRVAAAGADRRSFVAAVLEWIAALAAEKPVLLFCEDVHWSDPTTREAIDRLIDLVRTDRVLLVLTFRSEFSPPWRGTSINHLALQPLRDSEARTMVTTMAEQAPADATAIVERADGNPLFIEELMRHAEESRGAAAPKTIPLSLGGLLAARLDRLGTAKRLAQAAAVAGRQTSCALLQALVEDELQDAAFDAALARLLDGEILFQRGPRQHATFSFHHALMREAAYDSLTARERRRLHAIAAGAVTELDPETAASRPEVVAEHWMSAGRPDQAFRWRRRAGLLALERSAYAEASYHLEQALRTLRQAVPALDRRRQQLDLELAFTSLEGGRSGPGSAAAARHARRAAALCAGLALDDEVARALLLSARVRYARGELRATMRMLEPLWAFEDRIQDPYLRASIFTQAGNLMASMGRLDEAERFQDRSLEAYAQAQARPAGALTADPLANLQVNRAGIEWLRGRASASRRWLDASLAHTDRLGHPFSRAWIRILGASLALRQGDRTRFAQLTEEGARLADAIGSEWLIAAANVFAPLADASMTAADRAPRVHAALRVSPGSRAYRSAQWSELAGLYAGAGRPEEALRATDEAMSEGRRTDWCLLPEILRRRGELMAVLGRPADAEVDLRRALRAARRGEAFVLELRCALSLARLAAAQGRSAAGRRALSTTLARLPDDVDAPERAEAAALLDQLTRGSSAVSTLAAATG
jgi:tetratricopeptide (TPR) repeat protein